MSDTLREHSSSLIPSVTVIIPCYRQADLLARAIDSCLAQTLSPVEIVVVDDGGDPAIEAAILRYGNALRLLQQHHSGLASARNNGIACARGRFVKFLDADDWLLPSVLEHQTGVLQGLPETFIAICGHKAHYADEPGRETTHFPDYGPLDRALLFCSPSPIHSYLFPTALIRNAGGFSTESYLLDGNEDYELLTRLALGGADFVTVWESGCVYLRHAGSMSAHRDAIERSRNIVWRRFASAMLKRTPPPGVLADLLGGYAHLVATSHLGFEASDVVQEIAGRLMTSPFLTPGVVATMHSCADLIEYALLNDLPLEVSPAADSTRVMVRGLRGCVASTNCCEANSADQEPAPLTREFALNIANGHLQRQVELAGRETDLAKERAGAAELAAGIFRMVALQIQPSVKKVIVYGAGRAGSLLLDACRACGITVAGLSDSSPRRWGDSVGGVTVLPPAQCLQLGCDDWAIGSLARAGEIERSIRGLAGVAGRNVRIFRPDV